MDVRRHPLLRRNDHLVQQGRGQERTQTHDKRQHLRGDAGRSAATLLATNGSLSILASFNVKADRFATIVDHWNGRDAGSGNVTMK